jgi:hypothetical protein
VTKGLSDSFSVGRGIYCRQSHSSKNPLVIHVSTDVREAECCEMIRILVRLLVVEGYDKRKEDKDRKSKSELVGISFFAMAERAASCRGSSLLPSEV